MCKGREQLGYMHNIVIDWTCGLITARWPHQPFDTRTRSWNNYFFFLRVQLPALSAAERFKSITPTICRSTREQIGLSTRFDIGKRGSFQAENEKAKKTKKISLECEAGQNVVIAREWSLTVLQIFGQTVRCGWIVFPSHFPLCYSWSRDSMIEKRVFFLFFFFT